MGAALLQEAGNAAQKPAHLSPRSMGEISEVLARIRPTVAGIDDSYGASRQLRRDRVPTGATHSPVHKVSNAIGGSPRWKNHEHAICTILTRGRPILTGPSTVFGQEQKTAKLLKNPLT